MSRVYTLLRKLEERFGNIIFELDYSKITRIGKITIRDRTHLHIKEEYEIHNFNAKKSITAFDKDGKKVSLLKKVKSFDRCIVYRPY